MKGIIRLVLWLAVSFVLITYAGYKIGLYPAQKFREKATKDVKDEIADLIEASKNNDPGMNDGAKNAFEQLQDYLIGSETDSDSKRPEDDRFERWIMVKAVDGDTIYAKKDEDSEEVKIRYIGIDTPESVHADESKNTEEGKIASDRNAEILDEHDGIVYLEYDVQRADDYGRVLAYVYVKTEDGKFKMIQDILLEEGMAQIMTIQPNSKYEEHFHGLQVQARKNKQGFWATEFFTEE